MKCPKSTCLASANINVLPELIQTRGFLRLSHSVPVGKWPRCPSCTLNLALLAAPHPCPLLLLPSPPDNFTLPMQIGSALVWISFLLLQLRAIPRAFLTRYQQPMSLKAPYQLSVAKARRGNRPVPPCANSWAVVDGINCWYTLAVFFFFCHFPCSCERQGFSLWKQCRPSQQ